MSLSVNFLSLSPSTERVQTCIDSTLVFSTGEIGKLLGAKWKEADAEERAVSFYIFFLFRQVLPTDLVLSLSRRL